MQQIKHTLRVLAIHLINPRTDKEQTVNIGEELESLIHTLGGEIVGRVVQKLEKPDNATYIGKGKAHEVAEKVKSEDVDVVVLNAIAKPGQVHALKRIFQVTNPLIEVWDRVDLILEIFAKHAHTTEAKLQIELARMSYMGPRIYGMGAILSRQGGGIGTLGVGETNTELMKRHWRSEIKKVRDQLERINKNKEAQLERRKKAGFRTVSIVGYTNAGKSSLFNVLTRKNTLAENVLFATLDSSVGKVYIPKLQEEILLTDTIGFIRDLPPRLITAFKSTLTESMNADVLLHVIDVSDHELHTKISVVEEILAELGRKTEDIIFVFNKIDAIQNIDKADLLERYKVHSPIFVSVTTGEGVSQIQETIGKYLN